MRVILFQPQFAELVRAGTKTQTIRKAARCKPGDTLSLRRWTGKPYRSRQETIRESVCVRVEEVRIYDDGPTSPAAEECAHADGFATFEEMRTWFRNAHGLPFVGEKIVWSNNTAERRDASERTPPADGSDLPGIFHGNELKPEAYEHMANVHFDKCPKCGESKGLLRVTVFWSCELCGWAEDELSPNKLNEARHE